jgi:two-component system, chemotaxis family, sensor kinase CheA
MGDGRVALILDVLGLAQRANVHILDIVEETLVVERPGRRSGVLGSALIQQRVTDLLDVEGVVRAVEPGFFEQASGA